MEDLNADRFGIVFIVVNVDVDATGMRYVDGIGELKEQA